MMPNIFEAAAFSMECQRAIWLRMIKVSAGGTTAQDEMNLMISEKVFAVANAAMAFAFGQSIDDVFDRYRKTVLANGRRLQERGN